MELNKDIRDRILTAADALYEQAGRTSFPTVDSVRKVAKVNMNDAAATMKEWRRAQTAQAAPVAITVPEAVHQLHSQALAALSRRAAPPTSGLFQIYFRSAITWPLGGIETSAPTPLPSSRTCVMRDGSLSMVNSPAEQTMGSYLSASLGSA